MSRLALSASRGFDIIEFLATFPDRSFTMSEISRATGINIASCHSILATLTKRGYLSRTDNKKSYKLGLPLLAIGHGAERSHPMAVRAMETADKLSAELGLGTLLTVAVGHEVLAIYATEGREGLGPGIHVGERLPLVAPVGAPFYAWSSEEEIESWIGRRIAKTDDDFRARVARDIQLIRQRGYQLYLGAGGSSSSFASLVSEMSKSNVLSDYKGKISQLAHNFDYHLAQPDAIDPDAIYDIMLISAPILDRDGTATFNLGLGGFPGPITGSEIARYADRLLLACLDVMRSERTTARARDRSA